MAPEYHTIDLSRLSLGSGQGTHLELDVDPGSFDLGGSDYRFDDGAVGARLDLSRTATGYALRLRFVDALSGSCMRCLGPARVEVEVDAREIDQPASEDEELLSPYVTESVVDLAAWAHDALALALPSQILCRADCAGLCPVCGETLNDAPVDAHDHGREPDPRWAKLRELQSE